MKVVPVTVCRDAPIQWQRARFPTPFAAEVPETKTGICCPVQVAKQVTGLQDGLRAANKMTASRFPIQVCTCADAIRRPLPAGGPAVVTERDGVESIDAIFDCAANRPRRQALSARGQGQPGALSLGRNAALAMPVLHLKLTRRSRPQPLEKNSSRLAPRAANSPGCSHFGASYVDLPDCADGYVYAPSILSPPSVDPRNQVRHTQPSSRLHPIAFDRARVSPPPVSDRPIPENRSWSRSACSSPGPSNDALPLITKPPVRMRGQTIAFSKMPVRTRYGERWEAAPSMLRTPLGISASRLQAPRLRSSAPGQNAAERRLALGGSTGVSPAAKARRTFCGIHG